MSKKDAQKLQSVIFFSHDVVATGEMGGIFLWRGAVAVACDHRLGIFCGRIVNVMRVIAGSAKGLRLLTPKKTQPIRPALDQVKEAIFNILFDVQDLQVLDCFAGTGAVGIEALSRGAAHCVFIDHLPAAITLVRGNLEKCGFTAQATILAMPAIPGLQLLQRRHAQFDLIFLDPPYEKNLVNKSLDLVAHASLLAPTGLVIIEHHPKEIVTAPPGLAIRDQRKYGQTLITFLHWAKICVE